MKVYYKKEEYDWKWGSEALRDQLVDRVKYERPIYLVGENSCIMVNLNEIHFHSHKKQKEE
ncbi:MAG: hypothetical protein WCW65_00155 [Candidatus Paceibacterota bacterium]